MPKRPEPSAEHKESAQRVGRLINEAREKLELRIVDMAKAVGVSWQTAQSWDDGRAIPKGRNLLNLAKALKMSPREFQALVDETPPDWSTWPSFLEGEGADLSQDQRRRVARAVRMMLDDDEEPTLSQLVLITAAVRGRAG